MKDFKIDNKGSAQLFKNPFLEKLTRTNFSVPVIFYYLLAIVIIVYTTLVFTIPLFYYIILIPVGMFLFSFIEYLIHRFIFHFNATTESELNLQYNIHGVHHEFPRDKDRLVMPPVVSIFLALGFFLFFVFLFNEYGFVLFAGFIAGYSTYLIIHYAVHALKPPKNFLKVYWKHHSMHHYASVHSAFSVTFPFWDKLFGTMPPVNENNITKPVKE